MPYLKIRTAYDTDNDWTTINDLTLDKATITKNATITSVDDEINPKSQIVITGGQLKIGIEGNQKNLDEYLSLNTSECTVGSNDGETPDDYEWVTGKILDKGDLFIQQRTDGYSLLWYYDGTNWKRVHAIWG